MTTYARAEAEEALSPFHGRIRGVINNAFNDLQELRSCLSAKGIAPFIYERTTANVLFDFVIRHAHAEFGTDESVRVIDQAQTVKFCFGDKVLLRFKKGDKDHLGRNLPTQAVLNFVNVETFLPGMPPAAAKLEILYSMDDLETEIESVIVAARDGQELLWHYEIDGAADDNVVGLPLATPPIGDDDEDEDLVRPRVRKLDSESDSEGE